MGEGGAGAGADRRELVRVVLADDEPLLRAGLRTVLEAQGSVVVVGEAADGDGLIAAVESHRPDVVLADVQMPGRSGLDALRVLCARPDAVPAAVLTTFDLDSYVAEALRIGVQGFLLKDAEPDQLLDAVRRTHRGESLFAPRIVTRLVEHYLDRPAVRRTRSVDRLTDRETEVLVLVARGLSNDEIADALRISIKTVKTHIGNLLAKLAARDRAQLVITAYETGLVAPG